MLDILSALVSSRSVSPDDDGALDYLQVLLKAEGFNCRIVAFGEGIALTKNLYAEKGRGGKNICFVGHVDVVPAGRGWDTDPFKLVIHDDECFGRGVVDMKGAVAAMVQAAIDFASKNEGKVSILLTSDEEASGENGIKKMIPWLIENNINIDFAIVGEPTSEKIVGDNIKVGRRGSVNYSLTVRGVQGHAAYPEKAENPCAAMVSILHDLMKLSFDCGNGFFEPSRLTITSFDAGNIATNVIPGEAHANFNIRFNNEITPQEIYAKIESVISRYARNYMLENSISAYPFLNNETFDLSFIDEFASIVAKLCNCKVEFSTRGGTSDARFIKDLCPVVEFGLRNETAHKINENCKISDLQKLYNVYYAALCSYHDNDNQ